MLQTNVVGTLTVTQSFLPLLAKVTMSRQSLPTPDPFARGAGQGSTKIVMNLSSQLGSIEKCWGIQGRYGGVGCYRLPTD